MKKIFTLIAAAFMAVGVNAQTELDIDISQGWTWGWSSESAYADGVLTISITGSYGAFSTGWNSGADWSKYNKLCVVLESYSNDWGKVYFSSTAEGHPTIAEQSFGTTTTQKVITVNFEPSEATSVFQLGIQGKEAGDVIKVSRVYLVEAQSYGDGKNIAFDEWGNILASEFKGLSDQAKVEFTVKSEGEAVNDAGSSVIGWGIGVLNSINGSVKVADLPLQKIGDNVYSFTVAELKEALEAPADDYGRQGLYWNVWAQGKTTNTRVSAIAYEVSDTPTDIATVKAAAAQGVRYNLAGQQVDASYKGVVIVNGKKIVQK